MSDLSFFASAQGITAPRQYAHLLDELPRDVPGLCRIVQGLMIHLYWFEQYGVTLGKERQAEAQFRAVSRQLERILTLDPRPLAHQRPPECRLVGTCRDFTVLLTAMLRHQGIPARARCGFARYFIPNHYEDHWVCEYWNAIQARWVLVDAQLDSLVTARLQPSFDPLDVPRDQFLMAGQAWAMCRAGQADPDTFGIAEFFGMGFIRGNVVRDTAALNKIELLPWDGWGIIMTRDQDLTPDDLTMLDHVARLTGGAVPEPEPVQAIYRTDERFHVPQIIHSFGRDGIKRIDLSDTLL